MNLLRKLALAAVASISLVGAAPAADMVFSTGLTFVPTGPALFKGSDFNIMATRVNDLSDGSFPVTGNFAVTGTITGTSASASSLTVGPTGATNPALQVDSSTASQAAGLKVTGAIAAGTVAQAVISSGADANLTINAKGTGTIGIGTVSTGAITLGDPTSVTGTITGTSTSANALAVGPAGTTSPTLKINANTASAITGVEVIGAATGANVAVNALGGTNESILVSGKGIGRALLGSSLVTCSGTTTATCTGQRFQVSITGLTTAASTAAAEMVVTNTFIPTSAANVLCNVNGYSGTGNPVATKINPTTNGVGITILNVATSGALNATVPIACLVIN
jgi:hypothetical protein